jgi:hypothetical protein
MFSHGGRSVHVRVVVAFALAGIFALGFIPAAHAATIPLNSSTCVYPIGGSWSSGTCTLSTGYTISTGDTLEVPSGTTLTIISTGFLSVAGGAFLTIDSGGIINIQVNDGDGISSFSTITNRGTINIETSGAATDGIANFIPGGVIYNYGTINIENTGGTGVDNLGTITNECGGTIAPSAASITEESGSNFIQITRGCSTVGVPEFPFGLALLFVLLVPALLVLRKKAPAFRGLGR